jgi:hypothetical protein
VFSQRLLDELSLIHTQNAIVNKDGMEAIANGLAHKLRHDWLIDSAAHSSPALFRQELIFALSLDPRTSPLSSLAEPCIPQQQN